MRSRVRCRPGTDCHADEWCRLPPYNKKYLKKIFEQNNCQIIFLMEELNELLFNSDSDDEYFMGFEAEYIIK